MMRGKSEWFSSIFVAVFLLIGFQISCQEANNSGRPRRLPGITEEGKVLLPNQWSLRPAGRQIQIGDLPLNMQFSPDGRYLAITHGGHGANEIIIVKIPDSSQDQERIISRITMNVLWYGLVFSPDGKKLYAAGGKDDFIYEFEFKEGFLTIHRSIDLYQEGRKIVPAGMAVSTDGLRLYTANNRDH